MSESVGQTCVPLTDVYNTYNYPPHGTKLKAVDWPLQMTCHPAKFWSSAQRV